MSISGWCVCVCVCITHSLEKLTHCGLVNHMASENSAIIWSGNSLVLCCCFSCNGLLPILYQAITLTNSDSLSIESHFREISFKTETVSLKNMHLKVLSTKRPPFCFSLNVLKSMQPPPLYPHTISYFNTCSGNHTNLSAMYAHICSSHKAFNYTCMIVVSVTIRGTTDPIVML